MQRDINIKYKTTYMRTIIVIYIATLERVTSMKAIGTTKKYSFNTDADLKVGDIIKSPSYSNAIQVVAILDKAHKYYNSETGEMSDDYTSTHQWVIRTLIIRPEEADAVYGSIIKPQ
jgi:hypothetical protein